MMEEVSENSCVYYTKSQQPVLKTSKGNVGRESNAFSFLGHSNHNIKISNT